MQEFDGDRHIDLRDHKDEHVNRRGHVLTGANYKSVVDQLIEEALERGDFDDLPGKGKPLDIDENPFAGDMQLAYKMLKDNNYTLPWIEDRKEVYKSIDTLREKMERQWTLFGPQVIAMARGGQSGMAQRRWTALTVQWQTEIELLNRRIQEVNHAIPVRRLEILKLDSTIEMSRFGVKPTLDEVLADFIQQETGQSE